jgi:hypothetical protein
MALSSRSIKVKNKKPQPSGTNDLDSGHLHNGGNSNTREQDLLTAAVQNIKENDFLALEAIFSHCSVLLFALQH